MVAAVAVAPCVAQDDGCARRLELVPPRRTHLSKTAPPRLPAQHLLAIAPGHDRACTPRHATPRQMPMCHQGARLTPAAGGDPAHGSDIAPAKARARARWSSVRPRAPGNTAAAAAAEAGAAAGAVDAASTQTRGLRRATAGGAVARTMPWVLHLSVHVPCTPSSFFVTNTASHTSADEAHTCAHTSGKRPSHTLGRHCTSGARLEGA